MLKFRNAKNGYNESPSKEMLSEEYTHEEQIINGQAHTIGTKKTINLCDDNFAKEHFPNPDDYTLENLIKSGANLQETNIEMEQSENEILANAEKLSNKLNETNEENK